MAFNSQIKGYMTFGKSFSRGGAFPLEAYEIWTDYDALVAYAANTDPSKDPSYIGQKVAYVDLENNKVTHYGIEIDGTLKELGSSPVGDEKSIVVAEDGTVSLAGIEGLVFERDILGEDGQPTGQKENVQFQPLMTKDGLIWVEPSKTTVEGLASLIDGLTARVSALENDRVTEQELADAIKVEADRAIAAEEALGKRIDEIDFVDTDELATAISGVEAKIPTNNNQLENGAGYQTADDVSGAITTAIADKADKATTISGYGITDAYTKDEVDAELAKKAAQAEFEALKSRVEAFLDNTGAATEAIDTLQELITYINEHDDVELTDIIADIEALQAKVDTGDQKVSEYVAAAIDALKIGDYAKAADLTDLAGRVEALEKKPFETYATKSEVEAVDAKFDGVVAKSDFETFQTNNTKAIADARSGAVSDVEAKGYAVASAVEADLAEKVDAGTIAHTSDDVAEGVTRDGTTLNIVVDAYKKSETYTKGEVDTAITNKIKDMTGGESAKDVLLELRDYKKANDTEIYGSEKVASWTDTEGNYNPVYTQDSRIDTLDTAVAAAQAQADKGVADAKTANDAIATLVGAGGRIAVIEADVANLKTTTEGHGTTLADHETRVAAVENAIKDGGSVDLRFDALEGFQQTQAEINTTLNTAVNITLPNAIAEKLAITSFNETIANYHTKTDIATLLDAKADKTTTYTKEEVDGLLANLDQTEIENAIEANTTAIADIVGTDSGKTIREIATEEAKAEVAALVGEAPEALDTIHEIASWIKNDETGAAAMSAEIAQHSGILTGFGGEGQPSTVAAAIATAKQEAIDAIPGLAIATADILGGVKSSTAENKVAVGADGTMEVNNMNVNKLVQTAGDTLVINGGSAAE